MRNLLVSLALLMPSVGDTQPPTDPFQVPSMGPGWWRSRSELVLDGATVALKGTLLETLAKDAAALTSCERVVARWTQFGSPHNALAVVVADGCGQRVVYAYVTPPPPGSERIELYTLSRVSLRRP